MYLSLPEFCEIVTSLKRTNAEKALAVLWFHDHRTPDISMTSGQLTRVLDHHQLGTPHSTQLADTIRKSKLAIECKAGFSLKPGSRKAIRAWLPVDLDGLQPPMDHSTGYVPEAIWVGTRGYIESVCRQLNGCFHAAFYDAASVMLRRLLETLIIEAYEAQKRDMEIKAGDNNYLMLKDLVDRVHGGGGTQGLSLGREAKATLKQVKEQGDRAAHNRRFVAVAADLTALRGGVRTAVQELVQIANLKK